MQKESARLRTLSFHALMAQRSAPLLESYRQGQPRPTSIDSKLGGLELPKPVQTKGAGSLFPAPLGPLGGQLCYPLRG